MSKTIVTLEEKMKSEAEFGLFYYYSKIGKKKAEELRNEGFEVKDSYDKKTYPRIHRISWKCSSVEGDITKIDENSEELLFAQKLWAIATKTITK